MIHSPWREGSADQWRRQKRSLFGSLSCEDIFPTEGTCLAIFMRAAEIIGLGFFARDGANLLERIDSQVFPSILEGTRIRFYMRLISFLPLSTLGKAVKGAKSDPVFVVTMMGSRSGVL